MATTGAKTMSATIDNILAVRKDLPTQGAIAERIGVRPETITRWRTQGGSRLGFCALLSLLPPDHR